MCFSLNERLVITIDDSVYVLFVGVESQYFYTADYNYGNFLLILC